MIDPRSKLLWFLPFSFLIFMSKNLLSQLLLVAIIILGVCFTGISLKRIFKKIRYLLYFLPVTFFIHLIFSTTVLKIIVREGFFSVPFSIYSMPLIFTIRILNFMLFMSWFTGWVNSEKILDGIYLMLNPLKKIHVPVEDLFQVIFIAIRFFPILKEEYRKINENWRNYSKVKRDDNKILILLNNLISLLVMSFRKAEKIALAMHIRGYNTDNRTYYTQLKFKSVDLLFLFFSLIFFITLYKLGGIFETLQV